MKMLPIIAKIPDYVLQKTARTGILCWMVGFRRRSFDFMDSFMYTATAGIGTNLYLAKIAMDIVAKHILADALREVLKTLKDLQI